MLALSVTIGLTLFKVAVGMISGSVGVLSEAIHSALDLVSAAVAYFTIREAGKPADPAHPFGHGKFETLSSLLESALLLAASGFILFEAVDHIQNPHAIQHEWLAMITIAVSMVVSYWAFRHNAGVARTTESSALHVNALHFLSDVIASAGVLMGLILMKLTGWLMIDPIIAIGVAIYIGAISVSQIKRSLLELADTTLPEEEIARVRAALGEFRDRVLDIHEIRTRRSGSMRHIDFHLVTCGLQTVRESHTTCDAIEDEITQLFAGNANVTIHVEPCEHENVRCRENCPYRSTKPHAVPSSASTPPL